MTTERKKSLGQIIVRASWESKVGTTLPLFAYRTSKNRLSTTDLVKTLSKGKLILRKDYFTPLRRKASRSSTSSGFMELIKLGIMADSFDDFV